MGIPENKLNKYDYKIIKYVGNFESVSKEQILRKFSKKIKSIEYRLLILSQDDSDFTKVGYIHKANPIYLEEISEKSYRITELGKKVMEDYKLEKQLTSKERWKERILGHVFGVLTSVTVACIIKIMEYLITLQP